MPRPRSTPRQPAEPAKFTAVRRGRIYEEVVRQIQDFVTSGQLKPGDRLPPERELALRFQVSRSSLRDAIRTLELVGMVRSRQGEGTIVCELSPDALLVPLGAMLGRRRELVAELLDVRKMIEPGLAARAAAHAEPDQVARLAELIERQRQKMRRGEPVIDEDTEFHYTIALAAGNTVVRKLMDMLMDLLRESRASGLQVPGRVRRSVTGHRRILRAIQRHDARGAETAMRRHLREIEEVVMRRLART